MELIESQVSKAAVPANPLCTRQGFKKQYCQATDGTFIMLQCQQGMMQAAASDAADAFHASSDLQLTYRLLSCCNEYNGILHHKWCSLAIWPSVLEATSSD